MPATDSCQFSEYMELSESGLQCGYVSRGSECWNTAKVSQAEPKGTA